MKKIDLTLLERVKKGEAGDLISTTSDHLKVSRAGFTQMYTDGSKRLSKGSAFQIVSHCLGNGYLTGCQCSQQRWWQCYGHLGGLEEVRPENAVMCSDSAAALVALRTGKSESRPDLVVLNRAMMLGSTVGFVWVPAHVGIQQRKEQSRKRGWKSKSVVERLNIKVGQIKKRERFGSKSGIREEEAGSVFSVQSPVQSSLSMKLRGRDRVVITRLKLGHCAPNMGRQ